MSTREQQVAEIIQCRNAVKHAEERRCRCSSFCIQVQGCSCGRRFAIDAAKEKLEQAIEALSPAEQG